MAHHSFKKIMVLLSAKDFIDLALSKTQQKTPTVIHKHYQIHRIRHFYMRKVKFTQQNYRDRLSQILSDFPKLDDIHPFYADLMNILYDKDHYKLAVGQINIAKNLVDNVAKDYVRLMKYGDSLYCCKQLKQSAPGQMCTITKRQKQSLEYLEQGIYYTLCGKGGLKKLNDKTSAKQPESGGTYCLKDTVFQCVNIPFAEH
ncbi:GTP-binding protein 4-like isoform X1 [Tamandua tetradactyla]|uniref:GTP-binding protein 4-like isoform X1 n=1 Tax=Tamandua tetradactyla TaxID=48850 RepID=UPI004053D07D